MKNTPQIVSCYYKATMSYSALKSETKTSHFVLGLLLVILVGCSEKQTVSFQGYVEAEFVNISSSESGRLDRLLVTRGQQVSAGAPLFALDSESESAAYHQVLQQYNATEALLKDIRSGKRRPELNVIEAQLSQAIAAEKRSANQRIRYESLFKSKVVSQADLESAIAEAESNAARVRELSEQLEVAKLPARSEQIKSQVASMEAARAALEQANWKLRQKAVQAPSPSLVFDTLYREGEWVGTGMPVVRLLPPTNVKVRFFVPQPVLGALSIGQNVAIHCDGCAATIPAKITYISVEAEYTPPIIYSNETRSKLVFMIEAHPSQDSATALHPGQPVEVSLR